MPPKSSLDMLKCYIQWWAPINCVPDDKAVALRNQVFEKFCKDSQRDSLPAISPSLFGRLLRQALPNLAVKRFIEKKSLVYGYAFTRLRKEDTPPMPPTVLSITEATLKRAGSGKSHGDRKRKSKLQQLQSSPTKINVQSTFAAPQKDTIPSSGGTFQGSSLVMLQGLCSLDLNFPIFLGANGNPVAPTCGATAPQSSMFSGCTSDEVFPAGMLSEAPSLGGVSKLPSASAWGNAPENVLPGNCGTKPPYVTQKLLSSASIGMDSSQHASEKRSSPLASAASSHIAYFLNYVALESQDQLALRWRPISDAICAEDRFLIEQYRAVLVRMQHILTKTMVDNSDGASDLAIYKGETQQTGAYSAGTANVEDFEHSWRLRVKDELSRFFASNRASFADRPWSQTFRYIIECDKVFLEMVAQLCVKGRNIFTAPQCMQIVREIGEAFTLFASLAQSSPLIGAKRQLATVFVRTTHQYLRLEALTKQIQPIFSSAGDVQPRSGILEQISKFWTRFQSQEACNLFYKEMSWFGCSIDANSALLSSSNAMGCSQSSVQAILQWFAELLSNATSLALFFNGIEKLVIHLAKRQINSNATSRYTHDSLLEWQQRTSRNWTVASQVLLRNAAASDVLEPLSLAWMTKLTTMVIDYVVFQVTSQSMLERIGQQTDTLPLCLSINLPPLPFECEDAFPAADCAERERQSRALLLCFGASSLGYAASSTSGSCGTGNAASASNCKLGNHVNKQTAGRDGAGNWSSSPRVAPKSTKPSGELPKRSPTGCNFGKVESLWLDPELAGSVIDASKLDYLNMLASDLPSIPGGSLLGCSMPLTTRTSTPGSAASLNPADVPPSSSLTASIEYPLNFNGAACYEQRAQVSDKRSGREVSKGKRTVSPSSVQVKSEDGPSTYRSTQLFDESIAAKIAGFPENHAQLVEFLTQQYLTPLSNGQFPTGVKRSSSKDDDVNAEQVNCTANSIDKGLNFQSHDDTALNGSYSLLTDNSCFSILNAFSTETSSLF